MTVPMKGSLQDCSLPQILFDINRVGKTGTLTVTAPGFTKNVFIKSGNVIFASSTLEDDRLGEQLMKAGKINKKQYDKSVELLKSTGKRQGKILVELGFISPQDLTWGVRHQVKEIICSLFATEDGSYEFFEDRLPPEEVIILRVSMDTLVYDGIERIENLIHLNHWIPPEESILIKNTDTARISRAINLRPRDEAVLALFDGKRTIRDAIAESSANSLDLMRSLSILWAAGFVIEKSRTEKTAAREAGAKDTHKKPLSEEEQQNRKKFEDFFNKLDKMGPFEILGVKEHSSSDDVKKSYHRLAREFHPDRIHASGDQELKKKAATVFDAIAKAYEALKDEGKRKAYIESLTKVKKPQKEEETDISIIDEQFDRAIEEFKKGNFWGAAEFFRFVTRRSPKNPKAWSYLSLSLSKVPNKQKEAEEAMLEALKLEPFNSDHYANLGLLYLRTGLKLRARTQFEKALKMNPGNEKAKKGLEHVS